MRGFTLRALPVCLVAFAAGCFFTNGSLAPNTAGSAPTATHTYWQGVNGALSQRSTGADLKSMLDAVRAQTNALRDLPSEGVDEALVAAVDDVIRCEEEVLRVAEMFGNDATVLRSSREAAGTFGAANRKATDAKNRLRGLRDVLNSRHGGGFATIKG
jgi:hypothetical protein